MIRLTIFIIALLLAVEAMEATPPWLVTLAVLSGIELLRIGPFRRRRRGHRIRAWFGGPWDWDSERKDDW